MRYLIPLVSAALMVGATATPGAEPAPPPRPAGAGETAGPARIIALVEQLGDPDFARREAADEELNAAGVSAWYRLHRAAATHPNPEVTTRARRLAQAIARREFGEVRRFRHHCKEIMCVLFIPDGRQAVTAGGGVITFDLETGREVSRTMMRDYSRDGLALTRDGRRFLTSHRWDQCVRLADLATGKEVQVFEGHVGGVHGVALSPDDARAASAGMDGTVRIWDVKTGQQLHRLAPPGKVWCVAFSSDGRLLASGHWTPTATGHGRLGSDNPIRLWDVETGREVRRLEGHGWRITALAFRPDGRTLVSGSMDGTVRVWDVGTGREVRRIDHDPTGVSDVAVSPDGRRVLASGWVSKTVRLWDLSDGLELLRFPGDQFTMSVAFSPDGRRALTGESWYMVRLWNLPPPE